MYFANSLLYLINVVFMIVESMIALRILLKLFAANTSAPFVQWVYQMTQSLIYPFLGIFPSPVLEGGFIIEFSSLFALVVYGVIAYLISELIQELVYRSSSRTVIIDDSSEVVEERRVRRRR